MLWDDVCACVDATTDEQQGNIINITHLFLNSENGYSIELVHMQDLDVW